MTEDVYARIMSRPPSGLCDFCKAAPATTWWGQSSAAHCGAFQCVEACREQWWAIYNAPNEEVAEDNW